MGVALGSKQTLALVLLVRAILDQVDEVACLKANDDSAAISKLVLSEMTSVLKDFEPELMDQYIELLIKFSSQIERPPCHSASSDYSNLSAPAKRKFISTIRENLRSIAA